MSRLGFMLLPTTTSLKFFQQTKQAESQIQLVHFKFNEYPILKLEQHHVICKVTWHNLTLDGSMCLYEMNPIKGFYKKLFTTTWVFPKIVVSQILMVKIMENPINPWMIWGSFPTIYGNTQLLVPSLDLEISIAVSGSLNRWDPYHIILQLAVYTTDIYHL